jgi:hypothetical protein
LRLPISDALVPGNRFSRTRVCVPHPRESRVGCFGSGTRGGRAWHSTPGYYLSPLRGFQSAHACGTSPCLGQRDRLRFPKAIQGYSSLPKPIQAFLGKKDCLFFMRKRWWSALARPHPGPLLPERVNGGPAGLQRRHSISVHSRPGRVPSRLHLPPFRQPIPTFATPPGGYIE